MARSVPGYLGPYRLLNVVHTGHATQIWQAYDDANHRIVGVKTLLESDTRREQVGLLRQEYVVGSKIHHPRIIEMYAYDWDRGQPYLAMEWFSSPNMKQRIQQGLEKLAPLTPKIIEQAAESLCYFHQVGFVHRDVKPDNFLVADDGEVKLIDFALAKRIRRGVARWLTLRTKIQQGTKSYMSPEQIRGLTLDPRADLYSFACSIFELVAGRPPFTGTSMIDLLNKHLRAAPPSLESQNPNVTSEFAQLVRRCMAKDRAKRPKSVDDFLREFRMIRVFRVARVVKS
ncbi:MAG: serine/threonine protein kinase [Planctomycetaceae bacterium]|nr:serine/threonine protein kinase [Planctomycetaceae bacterium]